MISYLTIFSNIQFFHMKAAFEIPTLLEIMTFTIWCLISRFHDLRKILCIYLLWYASLESMGFSYRTRLGSSGAESAMVALLWGLVLSGFIKKLVSLCKGILHACGH